MPSNTLLDVYEDTLLPKHSLENALALLNKKKIGKEEIDQQTLLHRAADSGKQYSP